MGENEKQIFKLMYTLSIHIKSKAAGLVKEPCILLSYHNNANWATLKRMLDHRGVEHQFILQRPASDEEVKCENDKYRVGFLIYKSWKKLVNDEKKFTNDQEYLNQFSELQKRFKQFELEQLQIF